jgi:undecaprenyl-diphosphatase
MQSKIDKLLRSAAVRIAASFIFAAMTLSVVGWLVTGPYREMAVGPDASIRSIMRQLQSPMLTALFLTVTKLGSTLYLTVAGSIAGLIFIGLRWFRPLALLIVTMAGQAALHHGGKLLAVRPRPQALLKYTMDESFSFPSGHAVASLSLFVCLAWIITNRIENPAAKAGIWLISLMLVLLIGLSRVYIGVHYPTDVLAGYAAAAVWTVGVMSTDRKTL